jgi:hypothetical protein
MQAIVADPALRGHLAIDERAAAFDGAQTGEPHGALPYPSLSKPGHSPVRVPAITCAFVDRADRLISIIVRSVASVIHDNGDPKGSRVGVLLLGPGKHPPAGSFLVLRR